MAEALYPGYAPPSYESQFMESKHHQMNTALSPSAPPHPSYQERLIHPNSRSSSNKARAPHASNLQERYSLGDTCTTKQSTSKTPSSSEKVDLPTMSAQKRVPKRLPPPPPFNRGEIPVRPRMKPRVIQRPISGIPLGSEYPSQAISDCWSSSTTRHLGHQREGSFSRGSSMSTSMYDLADSEPNIDGNYRPMSATLDSAFHPLLHDYIGSLPLHPPSSHVMPLEANVTMDEGGGPLYAVPIKRGRNAALNRQASAPLTVHFQDQQVRPNPANTSHGGRQDVLQVPAGMLTMPSASEPTGHVYCINNSHIPQLASPPRQYIMDPQHSVQHIVHTPQASVQLQQPTVSSHSLLNPLSLMANSQMVPQSTGSRPLPKPRSLVQPANQLGLVPFSNNYASPPSLPLNMPSIPSPSNAVFSPQLNDQQVLATIPNMHTYSYTQQSSTVMMGIPQSQSSPLIAAISPHSNSITRAELPVQLIPRHIQQQPLQQPQVNRNVLGDVLQPVQSSSDTSQLLQSQNQNLISAHNLKPNTGNENPISSQETTEDSMQAQAVSSAIKTSQVPIKSPQKVLRKPVPKPRLMKRRSEPYDFEGIEDTQRTNPIANESNITDCQTPREAELETSSASAKPSRRHVRKPAPLPPPALVKTSTRPRPYSDPSPLTSASTGAPTILTSEITAVEQPHVTEELRSTIPDTLVADARLEAVSPTGYNVHDIFFNGNVIFLLPLSDPLRLPVKIASSSIKGRGAFKNDCKFEVVFLASAGGQEQTVKLIMLKSFSRMNHYLSVSSKGKIKMAKTATEKCKFIVRHVTEHPLLHYGVVSLESAIHLGWLLALSASGNPRKCTTSQIAIRVDESRFAVRAERIFNRNTKSLRSFERPSVVNQVHDRHVIQLQSTVSSKYLCINLKGKLGDTGNGGDLTTHFMFFDRGMGVVSLRSSKKLNFWLQVKDGRVQGNGNPDLASDFLLLEATDGSVLFESIIVPGIYLHSPCDGSEDTRADKNFKMKLITK